MHHRFDSNELNQWVITQAETTFPGIKIFERCLCTVQLGGAVCSSSELLPHNFFKIIIS